MTRQQRYNHSPAGHARNQRYEDSPKAQLRTLRYLHSDKGRAAKRRSMVNYRQTAGGQMMEKTRRMIPRAKLEHRLETQRNTKWK